MADIHCPVCGEPWDAYGARHGDMTAWEYELFRRGAGCPCCKGEEPDDYSEEDKLEDARHDLLFEPTDDDELLDNRIAALTTESLGGEPKRPKWERPEPVVIWTCAGCGVSVGKDVEDPESLVWFGGKKVHGYYGSMHTYAALWRCTRGAEEPEPEPMFELDGKPYCPGCATICEGESDCEETILQGHAAEGLDTYDPGTSFPSSGDLYRYGATICINCCEFETADCMEE